MNLQKMFACILIVFLQAGCVENEKNSQDTPEQNKQAVTDRPLYFKAEITTKEEQTAAEAWISESAMKVKLGEKRTIIIRADDKKIITLDPRTKRYVQSAFDEILQEVKSKKQAIEQEIQELEQNSRISDLARAREIAFLREKKRRLSAETYKGRLEKTEKTAELDGVECRLWRYTPVRDDSAIEKITIYASPEGKIGKSVKTFFKKVGEIACYHKPFAQVFPVLNTLTRLDGFPRKLEVKASSATQEFTETWKLEDFRFGPIDENEFKVPEGYRLLKEAE